MRAYSHEDSDSLAKEPSRHLQLTEMVYAIADARSNASRMNLDFLAYLLEMALQETLELLRRSESGSPGRAALEEGVKRAAE